MGPRTCIFVVVAVFLLSADRDKFSPITHHRRLTGDGSGDRGSSCSPVGDDTASAPTSEYSDFESVSAGASDGGGDGGGGGGGVKGHTVEHPRMPSHPSTSHHASPTKSHRTQFSHVSPSTLDSISDDVFDGGGAVGAVSSVVALPPAVEGRAPSLALKGSRLVPPQPISPARHGAYAGSRGDDASMAVPTSSKPGPLFPRRLLKTPATSDAPLDLSVLVCCRVTSWL